MEATNQLAEGMHYQSIVSYIDHTLIIQERNINIRWHQFSFRITALWLALVCFETNFLTGISIQFLSATWFLSKIKRFLKHFYDIYSHLDRFWTDLKIGQSIKHNFPSKQNMWHSKCKLQIAELGKNQPTLTP